MSVAVIVGTRPEVIKMAPVIKELESRNIDFIFIHTGQHYDYNLSRLFINELELPEPNFSFQLESRKPASQIGEMMIKLEKALSSLRSQPKISLIQGDTNSMLAAGLTSIRLNVRIGHVEAGLRSHDWRMPEEHNRRMIDHISDYLFAPTELAKRNLQNEKVFGEIFVTGNTVIDAINIYVNKIKEVEDEVLEQIKFENYALVTFHRAENVDNPEVLKDLTKILRESPIPIVFPIHPRTQNRLEEYGMLDIVRNLNNVQLMSPQGYFKFLALMRNASIILTDSGGLQEEATHPYIRKPVLILRTSTERPEAVEAGFAKVVGTNPIVVLVEMRKVLNEPPKLPYSSPFGDGKAYERVVNIVKENL
ncbi:MAG: UDP-N-acetylglucosamine 2-epimerase (non-hydrolyzing) [Candidatus Methanomethylicia archaeon]